MLNLPHSNTVTTEQGKKQFHGVLLQSRRGDEGFDFSLPRFFFAPSFWLPSMTNPVEYLGHRTVE